MMEYKGYMGKVEFDEDAGVLHGEVLGIRDVVTFQGESVQEIERAFRESVDDYLAFCTERGEEPDKPYSGKFMVRMDEGLHRQISQLAGRAGESLNTWVTERLREAAAARAARKPRRRSRMRTRDAI